MKSKAGRKPKLTPIEEYDIVKMVESGSSIVEVVVKYKVSERTIHRILKKNREGI